VQANDPETAVPRIIELVRTRIPQRFGLDPIRDIQVLCPMNRGGVGARSLNIELQAALNPAGERKVERFGWTFAPGDKVMQIENDYDKEIYNGDIGYVGDVDADAGEMSVSFDGRAITYGLSELDTLVPAYAATICVLNVPNKQLVGGPIPNLARSPLPAVAVRAFAFGHRLQAAHTSHAAIPPPRQAAGSLDDRAERERDCGGRYWPVFSLASPPNSRPRMTSTM
jgi:hypothetical protein